MAKILVVDDDEALLRSLDRVLSSTSHEVALASNGADALALLAEEPVDLVITDINMPEMDGIELLLAIANDAAGTPVIAISGGGLFNKEQLVTDARMLGAVEVVTKPFDPDVLLETVERLIADEP